VFKRKSLAPILSDVSVYESFVMKLLIYYDSEDNNNINKMHSKKQHQLTL